MKLLAILAGCILIAGCEPYEAESDDVDDVSSMSQEDRIDRFEKTNDNEVEYSNPNTGYSADYTLDVDKNSDGSVDRINFPNGGYLDDFSSQEDNGDGTITVETYDGREFTVDGSMED